MVFLVARGFPYLQKEILSIQKAWSLSHFTNHDLHYSSKSQKWYFRVILLNSMRVQSQPPQFLWEQIWLAVNVPKSPPFWVTQTPRSEITSTILRVFCSKSSGELFITDLNCSATRNWINPHMACAYFLRKLLWNLNIWTQTCLCPRCHCTALTRKQNLMNLLWSFAFWSESW